LSITEYKTESKRAAIRLPEVSLAQLCHFGNNSEPQITLAGRCDDIWHQADL